MRKRTKANRKSLEIIHLSGHHFCLRLRFFDEGAAECREMSVQLEKHVEQKGIKPQVCAMLRDVRRFPVA